MISGRVPRMIAMVMGGCRLLVLDNFARKMKGSALKRAASPHSVPRSHGVGCLSGLEYALQPLTALARENRMRARQSQRRA